MSLLQMSISGAVLILAIIVLRALTLHRLPKRTFLALWAVAVLRLLLPFSLPSALSVYTLAERWTPAEMVQAAPVVPAAPTEVPALSGTVQTIQTPTATPAASSEKEPSPLGWKDLWMAGAILCGTWFLVAYICCLQDFRTALPVEDERLTAALDRRLRRTVTLRQSDRVSAPLTYGVLHPIILLPDNFDRSDEARLAYILEHELTHIRRFDALTKLVLAVVACVHWLNPLVWCMYVLANRDIELSCDEAVVRRRGVDRRSEYAMTLIAMEERKSGLGPFASAFSKNAIEERITAIMKIKRRSLAAILAAIMLICGVSVAFATSAAENDGKDYLRKCLTAIPGDDFTEAESQRLFSLWFKGYEKMTVADYQKKMWADRDNPADLELIERYSLSEAAYQLPDGKAAEALAAFNDYFFHVYEPLTSEQWENRGFSGEAVNNGASVEYTYVLFIENCDTLTVGHYEQMCRDFSAALGHLLDGYTDQQLEDSSYMDTVLRGAIPSIISRCSTPGLRVGFSWNFRPKDPDPDADLYAQSSQETAAEWDRVLSPYVPFGLTYAFDDPDHDGNGLSMWFEGKEVRGIFDEQEGVWISEHSGITTYSSPDAIELYVVYTNGVLTGLRPATAEEQAAFTEDRVQSSASIGLLDNQEELREFPNATREDYDSFLTLRTKGYEQLSLKEFNQRLLDWANENCDAYNRINCDVIWNDCNVNLTDEERAFVSHTCCLSGTENGMMIRALHTGRPEEDPGFSATRYAEMETDGLMTAWCNLYYNINYHISDKSTVTVGERDRCTAAMMNAINDFWRDTDMDTLLTMTDADIVPLFNAWAAECGTDHVSFCHVTEDHIHYECLDERHVYDDHPQTSEHHSEDTHHSDSHGGHHG